MIDLQPLTATEPMDDDFGRAEALGFIDPYSRDGVDTPEDQLDALIADELFSA